MVSRWLSWFWSLQLEAKPGQRSSILVLSNGSFFQDGKNFPQVPLAALSLGPHAGVVGTLIIGCGGKPRGPFSPNETLTVVWFDGQTPLKPVTRAGRPLSHPSFRHLRSPLYLPSPGHCTSTSKTQSFNRVTTRLLKTSKNGFEKESIIRENAIYMWTNV